jgi:acyl-CoA thioester hydrolase
MKYLCTIQIRGYEVNAQQQLHHGNFARFLQYTATYASDQAGSNTEWYTNNRSAWVLRGLRMEFVTPILIDQTIHIQTWLSSVRRVRGYREYVIREDKTQAIVARAQADWVYIDRETLRPQTVPPNMIEMFRLDPDLAGVNEAKAGAPIGNAYQHTRTVQFHEIDEMNHANNAVYTEWFEQAWGEVNGATPSSIRAHNLEFHRAALLGEGVTISTQVSDNGVWIQEARTTNGNELIAKNCLVA